MKSIIALKVFYAILCLVVALLPTFSFVGIEIPQFSEDIANIFAWATHLLPVDLLLTLLAITASFYVFKITFKIIKFVLSLLGLG